MSADVNICMEQNEAEQVMHRVKIVVVRQTFTLSIAKRKASRVPEFCALVGALLK